MRQLDREARRMLWRFQPSPQERIGDALRRLLDAIEAGEVTSLVAAPALVRHGQHLAKAGGEPAMRAALDAVCAARPERADARRVMISAAWAGIGGWPL